MIAYPLILAVMDERDTAANSVGPNRPTENTEATVKEYCNKKVMISGTEYFKSVLVSVHILVRGSPNIVDRCTSKRSFNGS